MLVLLSILFRRYFLKSMLVDHFIKKKKGFVVHKPLLKLFSELPTFLDQLSSFTVNCRELFLASMVYFMFGMQLSMILFCLISFAGIVK